MDFDSYDNRRKTAPVQNYINNTQKDYNWDLCLHAQPTQSCVQGDKILAPGLGIPKAKVVR